MNKIIELVNLRKFYGQKEILKGINLSIFKNDFVVIKGESGSGKTTLLNVLGFIDNFNSGEYYFDNSIVKDKNFSFKRNNSFGFVFQNYNLIDGLSVLENIKIPYYYHKSEISDYEEYINELISLLKIDKLVNYNVENLSGGEKQRVAIARALSLRPKVILADEPTGNLDPINKKIIVDIFEQINKKYGLTILIVSHDDLFDNSCNRAFELKEGILYEKRII